MVDDELAATVMLAVSFVAAATVLLLDAGRWVNRLLALVILADALAWMSPSPGLAFGDEASFQAGRIFAIGFTDAVPALYLLFLGWALDIPLTRPLKNRWVRIALGAYAVVAFALSLDDPVGTRADHVRGVFELGNPGMGAAYLFGFIAAIWSARVAQPGTLRRRRAIAFALAFGIRDALQIPFLFSTALLETEATTWFVIASQLALIGFLAYGILQAQLFDIDLKLKWTLRRGTVATAFLLVFFVVSQLIERLASEKLGYISGALAAGVMLLAINPLQKTADKLADKAMPQVQDTAEYAAFRKLEVYKAAVEELAVGGITPKERRALDALRAKLDVGAAAASAMERDVIAARGVA